MEQRVTLRSNVILVHKKIFELRDEEIRLIQYLRRLGYGDVYVRVQDGTPVFLHDIVKKIKLTEPLPDTENKVLDKLE